MAIKNEYARGYADGTKRAKAIIKQDIEHIMGALFVIMHEKYGFGDKRLTRLNEDIFALWDYIAANNIDIREYLEQKTGLKIVQMTGFTEKN